MKLVAREERDASGQKRREPQVSGQKRREPVATEEGEEEENSCGRMSVVYIHFIQYKL